MPKTVVMFGPDGQLHDVRIQDVPRAIASGGERAIAFNASDGTEHWERQSNVNKALQAGAYVADPVDLTVNPPGANGHGEGTYKMERSGGDTLQVPYSMVGSAAKLGFVMDQADRPQYVKDAAADPHLNEGPPMPYGVKIVGRNSAGQPILSSASLFDNLPAFQRLTSSIWEPIAGTAKGLYHGLIEGPQNPAEAKLEEEDKIAGPLDVRIRRFITEPAKQQAQATAQAYGDLRKDKLPSLSFMAANAGPRALAEELGLAGLAQYLSPESPSIGFKGSPEDLRRAYQLEKDVQRTVGHGMATAVPGVGPIAASLGEQIGGKLGAGDYAGAVGSALGNGILMFAPELRGPVGEVLSKSLSSLPEGFRGLPRSIVSADDATEDMIRNFGNESQKVADENKEIEESNRESTEKVARARARARQAHEAETEKFGESIGKKKAAFTEKHQDWENRQQEAMKAHAAAKDEVAAENARALKEHAEAQQADRAAKEKAADDLDERKALEHKLAADQQELFERAQGAKPQAEAVNDALWDAWRDSVSGQKTGTKSITEAIAGVQKTHLTAPGDIAEFNKILKETSPTEGEAGQIQTLRDQTAQNVGAKNYASASPAVKKLVDDQIRNVGLSTTAADIPTEADALRIHVWKQQLERAVRKAENSGNHVVAGAFGLVLDQVRRAEDDLTAKGGPNASMLLDMARRQHQNVAEAFRDTDIERNPKTAQNIVIKEHAEDIAKAQQKAEALRRMSVHDPDIARLADEIKATESRLTALPKADALAKVINGEAPAAPELAPEPVYEDFAKKLRVGKEPIEPEYGEAPTSVFDLPEELQPEALREPKNKRLKELPSAQEKVVDLLRTLDRRLRTFGKWGAWVLRTTIGAGALRLFFQGHVSGFGETMLIGQLGVILLTDILRKESVLRWMARPTDAQMEMLDELPKGDAERLRQALVTLSAVELKRGGEMVSVDPRVAKFLIGTAAGQQPTLQQLQAETAERKPTQSSRQARTPGVTHVYDPDQGKIVPVQ